MSTTYLLPCPCGTKVPVTSTQAGQTLTCPCGAELAVPKLRDLRHLEIQTNPQNTPARATWGRGQGMLFATGMVVLLLGFGLTAYLQSALTGFQIPTAEAQFEVLQKQIDDAKVGEVWKLWTKMREIALQDRPASRRAEAEVIRQRITLARNIGLAICAAGLAVTLTAYSGIGRLLNSPGTSHT